MRSAAPLLIATSALIACLLSVAAAGPPLKPPSVPPPAGQMRHEVTVRNPGDSSANFAFFCVAAVGFVAMSIGIPALVRQLPKSDDLRIARRQAGLIGAVTGGITILIVGLLFGTFQDNRPASLFFPAMFVYIGFRTGRDTVVPPATPDRSPPPPTE